MEEKIMANCNCLAGFCCPQCDNEDQFRISAKTMALVRDDGVLETADMEWDDDSTCICPDCGYTAKVKNFCKPEEADTPSAGMNM